MCNREVGTGRARKKDGSSRNTTDGTAFYADEMNPAAASARQLPHAKIHQRRVNEEARAAVVNLCFAECVNGNWRNFVSGKRK